MTSYPKPTEDLPHFNPLVFTVDETPLTLADANKLYFKKSGGIITGAVSAPSLTLNGVNVENKLLQIDTNSNKLTDISYNNNVTYILNDLSINGILKLPNLTNAGSEILNNKQKTTKISYDESTSITTIGDTLKVPSTLIVGSNNYNVNDQFYKLTGISRGVTPSLTITDSVQINGVLNLTNNLNVDDVLSNFDTILVNMEYVQETDKLIIDSNVNVNRDMVIDGSLNIGNISDVGKKLIDVSNTVTTHETKLTNLSFNSGTNVTEIDGSLNIGNISDVEQKFYDISNTVTTHETKLTNLSFNSGTNVTEIDGSLNIGNIIDVEQKFYDISNTITTHETKLTNISYNTGTNVTEIDGSLNIGNIIDVEQKIYDISNTITTHETKLTNISYNTGTNVTEIDGSLNIGNITDVEQKFYDISNTITTHETKLTNISYNTGTNTTQIDGSVNITYLTLGNISNVEAKIIDISNNSSGGGTPYITYDSVDDKLVVEKDMDLSLNDLTCNFMRPSGFFYRLSQNHTDSYLEFRNGGHHLDSFYSSNGLGRALYLGYYSLVPTILSSGFVTQKASSINEAVGTPPGSSGGSLTLIHNDNNGTSSIVFKSKNNGSDFGYISYKDDVDDAGGEKSLLEIGVKNDSSSTPSEIDNIAIMPSGFLGINRQDPEYMLDLSGDMRTYDTIIGERPFLNTDGNGISIKPLTNPSLNGGSIFDVRTSLDSCRLFVGRGVTSCGFNNFCFGWDVTASNGTEGDPTNYSGILGTDGSVDCTEIKVNSIPINSFTNFRFGIVQGVQLGWGNGKHLSANISTGWYSHNKQFVTDTSTNFTCNSSYYGTYEITCNVIFRNSAGLRLNPCIGIAIDDDINDVSGSDPIKPKWNLRPQYQTPFSVQYVRNSEGRVCNLSCKRIFNFTNSTDQVSINTYVERTIGTDFNESVATSDYELLDASIKFKYLGNFDNITSS